MVWCLRFLGSTEKTHRIGDFLASEMPEGIVVHHNSDDEPGSKFPENLKCGHPQPACGQPQRVPFSRIGIFRHQKSAVPGCSRQQSGSTLGRALGHWAWTRSKSSAVNEPSNSSSSCLSCTCTARRADHNSEPIHFAFLLEERIPKRRRETMPYTELWRIVRDDHVGSWIKVEFAAKCGADMAERQRLEDDPTITTITRVREQSDIVDVARALQDSRWYRSRWIATLSVSADAAAYQTSARRG